MKKGTSKFKKYEKRYYTIKKISIKIFKELNIISNEHFKDE